MASGTMPADEMPVMREPYDIMRNGLPGAKAAVTHLGKHPVQLIQDNVRAPSAIGAQVRPTRGSRPAPCLSLIHI